MEKKDFIIIGLVAVIVIGALAIVLANFDFTGDETKTYDFESFTMNASAKANFTKNDSVADGLIIFTDNELNLSVSYVNKDNLIKTLGIQMVDDEFSKFEQIPSNGTVIDGVKLYKLPNSTNGTKYIATYETYGIYIIVGANDLETLIQMMNSIKLKNTTLSNSNEVSSENTPSKTSQESSSSNNEESEMDKLRKMNAEADAVEICPSCGVYTGSVGKYCTNCWSSVSDEPYRGGFL